MDKIVYSTSTGNSKQYANLLGEELNLPVVSIDDLKSVDKSEELVFIGWVMAGKIKGYNKIKKYNVKVVCAVGMARNVGNNNADVPEKTNINREKYFYLQGGFDLSKEKGIYKFMMNAMSKGVSKELELKESRTDEEDETLDMMKNGRCFVSKDNLKDVIDYCK